MDNKPTYTKITSDVDKLIARNHAKLNPPPPPLNETQRKVLGAIIRTTRKTGKPPTMKVIAVDARRSKITVRKTIVVLEDRGYLVRCTYYPLKDLNGEEFQ